ncbi:MAG: PKD domain-containing protein [Kiritimatiellae bacterium]|nr:PKD domain-containing protein [Kiritimatiellia bacterium]MDW8459478.1 PKD domain-containing protein [Verrucomicrobiota bacterium]
MKKLAIWGLFAAIASEGFGTTNILTNGGFESGTFTNWSVSGTPSIITNDKQSGSFAARFLNGHWIEQTFPTVSGQNYKVTAWVRIAAESGYDWGGFSIGISDYQSWANLGQTPFLTVADYGTSWVKHAFAFTAIGNASRIGLGYFGGSGRLMTVHVDEVTVFVRPPSNTPPQVSFLLSPTNITSLPATQTFAVVGDDLDGALELVEWTFGDGAISLDLQGARRVGVPGAYTARVRVADDDGAVVETNISWTAFSPGWPSIAVTNILIAPTALVQGTASGSGLIIRVSTDREILLSANGTTNWSASVPLKPGWNRLLAQAHQSDGRVVTDERVVRYEPADPLSIGALQLHPNPVEKWDPIEVTFDVLNSAATHPQLPYETNLPRGVEFADGITVDAVFSPDAGATEFRVPAFLYQPYRFEERDGVEWAVPTGKPVWKARFAPMREGLWSVRVEAQEAKGSANSPTAYFNVVAPTNPLNRGPIRVSTNDWRYYEFADGTPFLGNGFGLGGFDAHRFSLNATSVFAEIGVGNATYFRWWSSGHLFGNSWQPWSSRTRPYEGTVPPYMLSLESAYAEALGSFKLDVHPTNWLDPAFNPLIFQGFNGQSASLEPGKVYAIRVRWRTENITGPRTSGSYGVTAKLYNGWPEPGQTTDEPATVPYVRGDTPWHVASGIFTASTYIAPNLLIVLENVTGGRAFVDECAVHEVLPGGALGPAINGLPRFTHAHFSYNPRRGAGMDRIYQEAQKKGLYIRTLINEKQEWSLNVLSPSGLRDRRGGHFNEPDTNAPTVKLHEWHWRHLQARFGAFRSLAGIEFVNEEAPGPTDHFRLLGHMARWWNRQANPKPVSSSTWFGLAENAWKAPFAADVHATDFHAYTIGNWLYPDEHPDILYDSANYYLAFAQSWLDAQFGKPGHWGECSLYTSSYGEHPLLTNDVTGVWLHKWIWARSGAAFVYPTWWDAQNIWRHNLHHLFGNWNRFMDGIPVANSRYQSIGATSAHARVRLVGQKDVPAGHAYLWIDNRDHTWWRVVNGQPVTAITANIQIPMSRPNAPYRAVWYRTTNGLPYRTNGVTADASGVVSLGVSNLNTDTAVQLFLEGESDWDGDGDGIPDQWEARYVKQLSVMGSSSDLDGDGMLDREEYLAGTDPRSAASWLRISGDATALRWPSHSNRLYFVDRATDLLVGAWFTIATNLSAQPPTNSWPLNDPQGFYRIRALKP